MLIHLNGQLLPRSQARIDPFDRGFIFGEGVYEGLRAIAWDDPTECRIIGLNQHIQRMKLGLDAARIEFDVRQLGAHSLALLYANGLRDAFVYWQVTGGTPGEGDPVRSRARGTNTPPTVFGYCTSLPPLQTISTPATKKVVTLRDIRWEFGWMKSISLMGNVWSARLADERKCEEAIFIRGWNEPGERGIITEGLATNVLLVLPDGNGGVELVTPALDSAPMLAGVTRNVLLKLDGRIKQRTVYVDELRFASEVMLLGTTTMVTSVVEINGEPVGDGTPGPESRRLLGVLLDGIRTGKDRDASDGLPPPFGW